jgi:hypothetical protein
MHPRTTIIAAAVVVFVTVSFWLAGAGSRTQQRGAHEPRTEVVEAPASGATVVPVLRARADDVPKQTASTEEPRASAERGRLRILDAHAHPASVRVGWSERPGAAVTWLGSTDKDGVFVVGDLVAALGASFLVVEGSVHVQSWRRCDDVFAEGDPCTLVLPNPQRLRVRVVASGAPEAVVWFGRDAAAPPPTIVPGGWTVLEVPSTVRTIGGVAKLDLVPTPHGRVTASVTGCRVSPEARFAPFPPEIVFHAEPEAGPPTVLLRVRVLEADGRPAAVGGEAVFFGAQSSRRVLLGDGVAELVLPRTETGERDWVAVTDDKGEHWEFDGPWSSSASAHELTCVRGRGERAVVLPAPPWAIAAVYVLHPDGTVKGVMAADSRVRGRAFWRVAAVGRERADLCFGGLSLLPPEAELWLLSEHGHAARVTAGGARQGAGLTMREGEACDVIVPAAMPDDAPQWIEWAVRLPGQRTDVWLQLGQTSLRGLDPSTPLRRWRPAGCRARCTRHDGRGVVVVGEW